MDWIGFFLEQLLRIVQNPVLKNECTIVTEMEEDFVAILDKRSLEEVKEEETHL